MADAVHTLPSCPALNRASFRPRKRMAGSGSAMTRDGERSSASGVLPVRTRHRFPHRIKVVHHAVIPLSDGVELSAMIWMPEGAEQNPVPAILEYLPYRKRD